VRENEAIVIVGRKRTGKSTLSNNFATKLAAPFRRTLIIDVNGSPAYAQHEEIGYKKLKRWRSGGVYKFYDPNVERMFQFFTTYYGPQYNEEGERIGNRPFHGLIIFEDCTKYISANPSQEIKTFLVDHRMWDADLVFTFHSISMIPPFFWKMTKRVIILKTQDTLGQLKARRDVIPNWENVFNTHQEVMRDPNPFAHKVVETLL
jgi:hypothetical protein